MKNTVKEELDEILGALDLKECLPEVCACLKKAKSVFVSGAGRSGLIGKCFAMRLFHLGIRAYAAGETICPPIGKKDTLIAISCSGKTKTLLEVVKTAKSEGAEIICLTARKDSPLAKLADRKIIIPADGSEQFAGSLFEQASFILLESIADYYRRTKKISRKDMAKRHSNLQ